MIQEIAASVGVMNQLSQLVRVDTPEVVCYLTLMEDQDGYQETDSVYFTIRNMGRISVFDIQHEILNRDELDIKPQTKFPLKSPSPYTVLGPNESIRSLYGFSLPMVEMKTPLRIEFSYWWKRQRFFGRGGYSWEEQRITDTIDFKHVHFMCPPQTSPVVKSLNMIQSHLHLIGERLKKRA